MALAALLALAARGAWSMGAVLPRNLGMGGYNLQGIIECQQATRHDGILSWRCHCPSSRFSLAPVEPGHTRQHSCRSFLLL